MYSGYHELMEFKTVYSLPWMTIAMLNICDGVPVSDIQQSSFLGLLIAVHEQRKDIVSHRNFHVLNLKT